MSLDKAALFGQSARVLAGLNSPRFDSPGAIVGNAVSVAVFVVAVTLLIRKRRSDMGVLPWAWPLCILHVSYNGIYIPIGPALVLSNVYATRIARPALTESVTGSL